MFSLSNPQEIIELSHDWDKSLEEINLVRSVLAVERS